MLDQSTAGTDRQRSSRRRFGLALDRFEHAVAAGQARRS